MKTFFIKKHYLKKFSNLIFHIRNQSRIPKKELLFLPIDEDQNFVKGKQGSTWIEYYRSTKNKIYHDKIIHWMRDDNGIYNINSFEANINGLKNALAKHSELQSKYSYKEYNQYFINYINNLEDKDIKFIQPKKICKRNKIKGKKLLKRFLKFPKNYSISDRASECGYILKKEDGSEKVQLLEFYCELLKAKDLM